MKKEESKKVPVLTPFLLKENMIKSSKMMSLESQGSVTIKTDGYTSLKSSNKKPKVTLSRVKAKLILSMILDKLTKELKTLRYLFGIKTKSKCSKFKHQKI